MDDDRRAHHNELERRRRDFLKNHFSSLRDAIPLLEGEKVAFLVSLEFTLSKAKADATTDTVQELP